MGNFYVNLTVRHPDAKAVAAALADRQGFVTPVDRGYVVVFDREMERQDPQIITILGQRLSRDLRSPVLAVLNHDDDVLAYQLFADGAVIDEYNSLPDYFDDDPDAEQGGDAQILCAAFGCTDVAAVEAVLRKPEGRGGYEFAVERHEDLVQALGLTSNAVGLGYDYVSRGELPEGLTEGELLTTGR
jgi:hypothetical protein